MRVKMLLACLEILQHMHNDRNWPVTCEQFLKHSREKYLKYKIDYQRSRYQCRYLYSLKPCNRHSRTQVPTIHPNVNDIVNFLRTIYMFEYLN